MPLAHEVAQELRKLADALDLHPDVEVKKPHLSFYYSFGDTKDQFIATARLLPHPVAKVYDKDTDRYGRVTVRHNTDAMDCSVSIYRESICTIVSPARPAVYDCELTLLDHEDASLTEA